LFLPFYSSALGFVKSLRPLAGFGSFAGLFSDLFLYVSFAGRQRRFMLPCSVDYWGKE
jgi:hypothetical protein